MFSLRLAALLLGGVALSAGPPPPRPPTPPSPAPAPFVGPPAAPEPPSVPPPIGAPLHKPAPRPAPEGQKQRGVALGLFAEDVSFSYAPLLEEIAELGATHVALVVPLYQLHGGSSALR